MGIKVEDIYWRMYIDIKLKAFTLTMVPLSEPSHREIVTDEETLKAIAKGLESLGWQRCQRRLFEMYVRKGTTVV